MNKFQKKSLLVYLERWNPKEKRITIFGSSIFYLFLIMNFLIELIHVDYSLGLQKGFEGLGGINFLKSDLFFLIFTISIIFFEFYIYLIHYSIKGPIKRIINEKTIDDLFIRRNKSQQLQNKLLFFLIIISTIYIFDNYIRLFIEILYQFIIIELFLNLIFCLIDGIIFFSLIMVTIDTKILKDSIYNQKNNNYNLKTKTIEEIFQIITFFIIVLMIGNLFLLFFKII